MNDSFSSPSSSTRYFSSSSTTTSSSNDEKNKRNINLLSSQRGRDAVGLLPKYLSDARAVQKYHPVDCPDGALQLSVAENQMLEDLLVPAYRNFIQNDKEEKETFLADQIYYQPTHGRPGLRNAMAQFLTKLLNLSSSSSLKEDNLIMGAGCNAVLENLAFTLANPGDVILIPTPYYAAFEFDLVARAGLQIIPVETQRANMMEKQEKEKEKETLTSSLEEKKDDNKANNNTTLHHVTPIPKEAYYPTRESLDIAYENCMEQTGGKPPKILLLSHPNNPLGVCYPPHVIRECIDWSIENKVHLISDEIYAGSVYKEGCFTSALSLASSSTTTTDDSESKDKGLGLGPYIHFVYALSKDFASSGLRVGVAYTENEEILLPMQKLNDLCQISSQTQLLVERMLSNDDDDESKSNSCWSFDFLKENNIRIHKRVSQLMKLLDQYQITYLEPDSGLFLWMDLREFLLSPSNDDDGKEQKEEKSVQDHEDLERELYLDLMHNHGLLFTPGMSMRNAEAGFFRLVFTAATDQEFELALERLEKFIVSKRS